MATLRPHRIVSAGLGITDHMKGQRTTTALLVTPLEDARLGTAGAATQSAQAVAR